MGKGFESTRTANGFIGINGVNIWGDIKEYVTELTYEEVACGETDSFEITMHDSDEHWINDWLIDKGTELNAKIQLKNWNEQGDELWIDCGEFLCDALKVTGFPLQVTIKSLALPLNGTKNTKKWENISISAIAEDMCKWIGCELRYYADDIVLKSQQQSRETDISFLFKLCSQYGLGMKVFRHMIIIFNREEQDAADPAGTFDIKTISSSFELDDNQEGTYTGAKTTYKLEGSDNEIPYEIGTSERVIEVQTSATSVKEAELLCKAALYNANIEAVRLRFTALGGQLSLYSNTNYYITGLGKYSGKYAMDRVTHKLSGTQIYTIEVEAHAVTLEKDS